MRNRLTWIIVALLLAVATKNLFSQQEAEGSEPLPRGFGEITLGLSFEEVRRRLEEDRNFNYRGGPDVSLRPFDLEQSIETEGRGFMDRGSFQFADDLLYIITLFIDQERLDYFTLYRTLSQKYGEPESLNPQQAVWENEEIRIALQRPLTIQYIDRETFGRRVEEGAMEESLRALNRNNFLEQF
ncbi:MAG: hypothetical protein ACOC45_04045 [Alkalispirochaetaceae bacterium]